MRRPVFKLVWLALSLSTLKVSGQSLPQELTYQVDRNREVIITKCSPSAEGEMVIPSVIEGRPVTSIGQLAFYKCESLTAIVIPDTLTTIEGDAFSGCASLTSINLPVNVSKIGGGAFRNCSNLISITIPDKCSSIYEYSFSGCTNLKSVKISAFWLNFV